MRNLICEINGEQRGHFKKCLPIICRNQITRSKSWMFDFLCKEGAENGGN